VELEPKLDAALLESGPNRPPKDQQVLARNQRRPKKGKGNNAHARTLAVQCTFI
jgi:hypothetical protein